MKMEEWQRLKDLQKFSIKHKIKIASIEDLIAYRLRNEKLISKSHNKKLKSKIANLLHMKTNSII